jgi:ribosomal-protein-alanine N-acetyltransferase
MVARPPVMIVVDRMQIADLEAVHEIERDSFSTPWPAHAYQHELENNRLAHYLVARSGDQVVGFAGIWLLVDEAHITTFATRGTWRRQGIGERLLLALLDLSIARGANEATLEVRPSNDPARRLYEKYGFKVVGVRPRYYSDNNEDALIMTTPELEGPTMHALMAELRVEIADRPDIELGADGLPIAPPSDGSIDATETGAQSTPGVGSPRVIQPSSTTRREL